MKYKQRAQFERLLWSEFAQGAHLADTGALASLPPACTMPDASAEHPDITDSPHSASIPDT